jgi:hypothetical protein
LLTNGTATDGGGGPGVAGTANTGGGGGCGFGINAGAGGSGIVILKLSKYAVVTKGASHTMTITAAGDFNVYTFTAGDDDIRIGR